MITIEYIEGLPIAYESFLINRYHSFITTCRYIEIYHADYSMYYMLVHTDGNPIDILIFGNKGTTARCFNALVNIDQNLLEDCLKIVFKKSPYVHKVMIDASLTSYKLNNSFLIKKSEDHVLKLPVDINEYYQKLGSSTRKNIKSRKNKLSKNFSSVNYITKYKADIEEKVIDKIVQLNYDRIKHKGGVPAIDNRYRNNIYKYSQYYGCVTYLELDEEIVAGCIATILNKEIFLHVFAHDNHFSKYNVGESCIVNLINNSVEKKLSTFHFLWGKSELKARLQGKPDILFSYFVYRAYSVDYLINFLKANLYFLLKRFKVSGYSLPIRNTIIYIQKLKSKV